MTKPIIIQAEHPILRQIAEPVSIEMFGQKSLAKIIDQMSKALAGELDGAALAAPQIGISLRIFIVNHKIFSSEDYKKDLIFINPQIVKQSKKTAWQEEGCLSVRNYYGEVERSVKATVSAFDFHGQKFEFTGNQLMAQIFQHEIDHLNGILFIDKARNLKYVEPEK